MSFFYQFLKSPMKTGAVFASGESLSKAMVHTAKLKNKRCVVELGPGTGAFTKEIVRCLSKDSTYFCLDINKEFVKKLKATYPKLPVYAACVNDIQKYLKKHQQKHCDVIISGIPWSNFGKKTQQEFLENLYDSLSPQGEFLTFGYIHSLILPSGAAFRKLLAQKFSSVTLSKMYWKNLPPAFIICCKK